MNGTAKTALGAAALLLGLTVWSGAKEQDRKTEQAQTREYHLRQALGSLKKGEYENAMTAVLDDVEPDLRAVRKGELTQKDMANQTAAKEIDVFLYASAKRDEQINNFYTAYYTVLPDLNQVRSIEGVVAQEELAAERKSAAMRKEKAEIDDLKKHFQENYSTASWYPFLENVQKEENDSLKLIVKNETPPDKARLLVKAMDIMTERTYGRVSARKESGEEAAAL